jgi:hypothetical protein
MTQLSQEAMLLECLAITLVFALTCDAVLVYWRVSDDLRFHETVFDAVHGLLRQRLRA